MKNKVIAIALVALLLTTFGCGRSNARRDRAENMDYLFSSSSYSDLAWEGVGYNPEGVAGISSQSASAFRDMSDLYGRTSSPPSSGRGRDGTSESANLTNTERKLVKRASVRIRVENLGEADIFAIALMKEYNAYAASTSIEENNHYYSLRVPAEYYEVFLAGMNGMGRMLYRQESTEDVTLRYYDLEGQLATKKELLRTFQTYLGRANNIEEILAVEARISHLQYDIEGTGTQLRNLANRIDYATIDLHLSGPAAAIPTQTITFGEKIKQLFGGFGGFLSTVALTILGIIIYGIPVLLLLGLLFWLFFGKIGLARKLWSVIRK